MHWTTHAYTISLIAASAIALALAGSAWKTRTTIRTRSFTVLMLIVSLWSALHIFEVAAPTLDSKVFWANMQFLCIVFVPPALLIFVLRYTRRDYLITPSRVGMLSAVPLAVIILVWTNGIHGWVFTDAEIVDIPPFRLLYRTFGTGFWIHTGYCYAVMLLATILLLRSMINAPGRYKGQVISMLIGIFAPWIGNVAYIFSIPPLSDFDLTPVVFTVSGLAFAWGVFRHRLLDIVPIAYDFLLNNMQDAVFVFDRRQRVLDLNPAAAELTGVNCTRRLMLTADQLIPDWLDLAEQIEKGRIRRPVSLRRPNGERFFDLAGTPLRHDDQFYGYLVVLRDITQYRETQLALLESEQKFKSLSENAPMIICTLNPQGLFTYINPEWENILGHPRKNVVGRHFSDFVPPHHIDPCVQAFCKVRDHREILSGFPIKLVHADGTRRFFNGSASPNLDNRGTITEVICLLKDQTGERELQEQLFQSQKMEAVGTLAGGIAHDFNNLLMGIQANVSLVRMEIGQVSSCLNRIETIEHQIQTGASLTRQLLGYARKGKYRPMLMCLNQLVQETLEAFGRTRKQLTIRFDRFEGLPRIVADRGQMELVLLNLLVNASDAMPEGGHVIVKTDLVCAGAQGLENKALHSGSYVHLQITDTGMGMDDATKERIFEPFFTTKEMGHGTGLGLASVYGVVKNHNGAITVRSTPGKGSTFNVFLEAAEATCGVSPAAQPLYTGSGQVLFVDDEPELLEAGTAIVKHLGYDVVGTDNAFDAMRRLSETHHRFDLAVVDLIMPGMGGKELFGHIRRISPDTRILLSTGYSEPTDLADLLIHGQTDMIGKPYTAEALSQKISQLMTYKDKRPGASRAEAS